MPNEIINVEGMTCGHCVETVKDSVNSLSGIKSVLVDLEKKQVNVDYDDTQIDLEEISSKIQSAGFEVIKS